MANLLQGSCDVSFTGIETGILAFFSIVDSKEADRKYGVREGEREGMRCRKGTQLDLNQEHYSVHHITVTTHLPGHSNIFSLTMLMAIFMPRNSEN